MIYSRSTEYAIRAFVNLAQVPEGKYAMVKQIAEQVGYSDQFYFSRDFKRLTGVSPSEFRKREGGTAGPPGGRGTS